VDALFAPVLFDQAATHAGIATAHSLFNIACTCLLLPASSLLEKLAYKLVPETENPSKITILDERLLATPAIALERSRALSYEMAQSAISALEEALACLRNFDSGKLEQIRQKEDFTDRCEDEIGAYLVKLSAGQLSDDHSTEAASLLKIIGDLERIGDHAMNLAESAEELHQKRISLTGSAEAELNNLCNAMSQVLGLTCRAFVNGDMISAAAVEPLEEVIDQLKERYRSSHIKRLQRGECTIEAGFVWSDILTDLERTSDHCSNIALNLLEGQRHALYTHDSVKTDKELYDLHYDIYVKEYLV
jgi:phosphate:Na+ symporter